MSEASAPADTLRRAVGELVPVLRRLERTDLADRVTAASARLKRPSTVVCVVGEFKQGKSSLVNGLLGQAVCPVDDDLATAAITLVRFSEDPAAVVRTRDGDQQTATQIAVAEVLDWVSEAGNPDNVKRVERVDIGVPSPLLRQGLVLVDTPGMGGLGAGHAAATLAFLPFADGLIFVSDASAELSEPEVAFLRQATDLCPTVMFAQTKTDLYPSWSRIADLNRGHLARQGVEVPTVHVSSSLRAAAIARKDRELNEASGFPALLANLSAGVIEPARSNALARSVADVRSAAQLVGSGVGEEIDLLRDPSRLDEALATLAAAQQRLEHLRGPGARWSTVVGDRIADLSNDVNYAFRGGMRSVGRSMDEQVEALSNPKEWDEIARDLQTKVAEQVAAIFRSVEEGRVRIREEVIETIQEEDLPVAHAGGGRRTIDVADLWVGKSLDDKKGSAAGRAAKTGLTGIRGAQSGVMMFGMMGGFLPAAAAVFIASNPVLLGAGALFGGWQLLDERKRKLTTRRQAARSQVRQFLDDVQFEVANEIGTVVRGVQRELRDEFTQRLGELQRTYTDTARQAQENAKRSQADAGARLAELEAIQKTLAAVSANADSLLQRSPT